MQLALVVLKHVGVDNMENSTTAMSWCITYDVSSFLCAQVHWRLSVANQSRMTLHLMIDWPREGEKCHVPQKSKALIGCDILAD